MDNMIRDRKIVTINLAAGKGTRMRTVHIPKVCFSIEGKPAIARAIETYQRCGIDSHFVVVSHLAEQVMQATIGLNTNIFFCHQQEQLGTGNAAKAATKLVNAMDYSGDILVVAGDKIFDDSIIIKLINNFYSTESDLAFLVSNADDSHFAGRVVYSKKSEPVAIVEAFDAAKIQLLQTLKQITETRPISSREARSLAMDYLGDEKKAAFALGSVWDSINEGYSVNAKLIHDNFSEDSFHLSINNEKFELPALLKSSHKNQSTYMFKAEALYFALDRLTRDNAQQEEYLTETINILSREKFKIHTVPVNHSHQVMAFNTPEELEDVRKSFATKNSVQLSEDKKAFRLASQWLKDFEASHPSAISSLAQHYSKGYELLENKRRTVITLLNAYIKQFNDTSVAISRASGRINMMGRHVDHQGGYGNMMALDKEIYCIAGERKDNHIRIHNLETTLYSDRDFEIDTLIDSYNGDWFEYVSSDKVRQQVNEAQGDWSQYIKAIVARLQTRFSDKKIKGMNLVFSGDIPIAAGLSSSSALVVAVAQAIAEINNLKVPLVEFIELCAEAEWYVGTRGGAGDHAAMLYCKKGTITQLGYFPVHQVQEIAFPDDYALVICNSMEKARKTARAKDIFNHRVACYHISREMFKKSYPEHASKIKHLRDINFTNLGVTISSLLKMIKKLPSFLNRDEIANHIGIEKAREYLDTHSEQLTNYPIRNILLFGLGEIERSRIVAQLIKTGNIDEVGNLMNISHNGDRILSYPGNGESIPYSLEYADKHIDQIIAKMQSPEKFNLEYISGSYGCSSAKIDHLVDISLSVKGVVGAQLAGAGLGGCIMVLIKKEFYEDLYNTLIKKYYEPAELEPAIFLCNPAQGSSMIAY